jgi:hypothetical protein
MIGDALVQALNMILPVLPLVMSAFEDIVNAIMPLIPMLLDLAMQLIPPLVQIIAALAPVVVQVVEAFLPLITLLADMIMLWLPPLLEIVEALVPVFAEVAAVIGDALVVYMEALTPILPVLIDAFMRIVEAILPLLPALLDLVTALLPPLIDLFTAFLPVIEQVAPIIADIVEAVAPFIVQLVEFLTPAIKDIGEVVADVFGTIADIIAWVLEKVVAPILTGFGQAMRNLGTGFRWVYDNIIKPVWDNFSSAVETVKNSFTTAVDWIAQQWESLKDKLRGPVQWVVDFVWNDGLRKLWNTINNLWGGDDLEPFRLAAGGVIPRTALATGGVLPGYTPGRDIHRFISPTGGVLDLSGGEAVMRPEFTAALGVPTINLLNELARKEGVAGLRRALGGPSLGGQQFARGGIINLPGWLDTALDWIPGMGSVSDLIDALNRGDGFGGGMWGDALFGTLKKIGSSVLDAAQSLFGGGGDGPAAAATGLVGAHYTRLFAEASRLMPGIIRTSGLRPGDPGYHGRGLAVDLGWAGNAIGPLRTMQGKLRAAYPGSRELIGPAGPAANLKNGRHHPYNAQTQADHQDHVHWVAANGGVLVRDVGGFIPPGMHTVYNGTGRNEYVLDPRETDNYLAARTSGGGGAQYVNNIQTIPHDPRTLVALLTDAQRDREFLHG